jgi:arylsulfatase A-like enzyme
MIENMDHHENIGKYGNTLIIFTSDNGGSEAVQLPQGILVLNGSTRMRVVVFINGDKIVHPCSCACQ